MSTEFDTLDNITSEITGDILPPSNTVAGDGFQTSNGKKNGKKKPKSKISIDPEVEPNSNTNSAPNMTYQQMGMVMAQSFISICMIFGGEDFRPNQGEPEALTAAWAGYFEAKGIEQFSPEVMLVMVSSSYVVPRLTQPSVKNRIWNWYQRFKNRRNARTNSGNNHQWENNTGETTSGTSTQ